MHWFRLLSLLVLLALVSACATQPPWERTDPDKQAEAYANLGMGHLDAGNLNRALREFDRALELRPRHPRALHGMALTLEAQGEYSQAEHYFQQVLRVDRNKTSARNNYAAFLFGQNRYDEARSQLEIASEDIRYTSRDLIFENLGYVALALEDLEAAQHYFQRSLRLNGSRINAHRELLRLGLQLREFNQAQRHWQFLAPVSHEDRDLLQLGLKLAESTGNQQEQDELQQRLDALNNHNNR